MMGLAMLALSAVATAVGSVAAALGMCWIVHRFGKLTRYPSITMFVAFVVAVAVIVDAFSLGSFPRVCAAFALPMLLFVWASRQVAQQAPGG